MKFGTYFAYWEQEWKGDYPHYVERVKRLGFDILEVAAAGIMEMSSAEIDNLRDLAKDRGIVITAGIGLPPQYNLSSADESVRQNGIKYVKEILSKLRQLDCHSIGGNIYGYWPFDYSQPIDKPAMLDAAVKSVKEVVKVAEEYDINYCCEVLNRFEGCLLNTAAEGVAFCKQVDSPKAKVLLDTFHMNIEEDFIGDAIRSAKGYLGELHIGECNRKVPGQGHMPWEDIAAGVKDSGFDGPVVMEPFVRMGGQVGLDIKVFHDLSNNATDEKLDSDIEQSLLFTRKLFA